MAHYYMQNEVLSSAHSHGHPKFGSYRPVWPLPACLTTFFPLCSCPLCTRHSPLTGFLGFAQTIPLFFSQAHPLCCPWLCQNSSPSSLSLCSHTSSRMPSHILQAVMLSLLHSYAPFCFLRSACRCQILLQVLMYMSDFPLDVGFLEVQAASYLFSYSAWNLEKCIAYSRHIE